MDEYTTPIGPLFELQRETLKRGADILQFPREMRNEFVEDGLAASEQIQRQTIELSRQAVQESVSTVEILQSREQQDGQSESVDELFDTLLAQHEAAYETIGETYEQADTETLTREVEQLDFLLELSQRIETELERSLEGIEQQVTSDELQREIAEAFERAIPASGMNEIPLLKSKATEIPITTPGSADDENEPGETQADGKVECRVCGERFGAITYSHLQTHEMTVDEYRSEFGEDVPL